ncbi:hypothetical protein [Methylobacterium sp. D54C]
MNGKTLQSVLSAVRHEDRLLKREHAELNARASYRGQRPERADFEDAYGRETTNALMHADHAHEQLRKALKVAIEDHRRSRNSIRVWLWQRGLWRVGLRFSRLPGPLRRAWAARRAAFDRKRAAGRASWDMSLRIGAGDLALKIAQECSDAEYEHQRASAVARVALADQATITATRDSLATVLRWGGREQRRFEANRTLRSGVEARIDHWIVSTKVGSRTPPPIIRVTTGSWDNERFRNLARSVAEAWLDRPLGLANTHDGWPRIVHASLAKIRVPPEPDLDGVSALRRLWQALENPNSSSRDLKALLYWVASAAEIAMIRELTAKTGEEPSTTLLMSKLRESNEKIGGGMFDAIGYGSAFPFHVATFEADKMTEAETGVDFGAILHIGHEDGYICRAALIQAKLAGVGRANIHRASEVRGNMHQLAALMRLEGAGYYLFLDNDPVTGPPAAVVPAAAIARRLMSEHGVSTVTALTRSQCDVDCYTDAVDFGTFFGFTLLENGHSCTSIAHAIQIVGGTVKNRIAAKLMVIQIGSPLDRASMADLERLGYRETRSKWDLDEMVRRAARSSDAGPGR